jgi:hypothetical protein
MDSLRLALKVKAGSSSSRAGGERRRRVPLDEVDALCSERPEPAPVRGVVEVVTADLTRDPRHEK